MTEAELVEKVARAICFSDGTDGCGCESDCQNMHSGIFATYARAAIAAARPIIEAEAYERDGWQPIETAPKDGTEIVMLDANVATATVGYWMVAPHWPVEIGAPPHRPAWFPLATPTHWCPLPAPPGTGQ